MVEWANAIVFDILGDLLYARSYDIKEPGPNDQKDIPKLISEFVMAQHSVSMGLFVLVLYFAEPVIQPGHQEGIAMTGKRASLSLLIRLDSWRASADHILPISLLGLRSPLYCYGLNLGV